MTTEQEIKNMANRIRATLDHNMSSGIDELERLIKDSEKTHRSMGSRFTRGRCKYKSLSLAVDLFLVKTIAEAVKVATVKGKPRQLKKRIPLATLGLRGDYLLALGIVSRHLGLLFQQEWNWCQVKPKELQRVSELCDYTEVICID